MLGIGSACGNTEWDKEVTGKDFSLKLRYWRLQQSLKSLRNVWLKVGA